RPSYGSILLPLYEEDGLRMGELAARARLSKQTMTTMVRMLERDGLVRRRQDAQDRRAFRITLTLRARRFRPVADAVLRELDAHVRGTGPGPPGPLPPARRPARPGCVRVHVHDVPGGGHER